MIRHIDLRTVKKEDLTFKVPFSITATRNDYVHAYLAWFDINFSCCHKPVKFSTGPHAKYTHWKQTVFYTPETLTVSQGQVINGTLDCAPNKVNNRDLDIVIEYAVEGGAADAPMTKVEYKMYVHVASSSSLSCEPTLTTPSLPSSPGAKRLALLLSSSPAPPPEPCMYDYVVSPPKAPGSFSHAAQDTPSLPLLDPLAFA